MKLKRIMNSNEIKKNYEVRGKINGWEDCNCRSNTVSF